ncbi:hypothetical protein RESH_00442 [Rhodopirellula europaea SH398]|uniref:Uncharacterized protein n=2 Tax=Rhodopirellula europaea TaxID=1263866 RepID=M2B0R2_9BACT|nr:hypothetical protein RE6C_03428 [Rhodopirellula europaea 6C]EMI28937.1 hypothetical protein RESH_00442 [Rhodopirellula europaea SH398]
MPWAGIGLPRWGEVVKQNLRKLNPLQQQLFESLGERQTAYLPKDS